MRTEQAEGEVIDIAGSGSSEESSGNITDSSNVIVRFKTNQGETIEFEGKSSLGFVEMFSDLILKKDTSKVTVLYDPQNPKRARIKNFPSLYLLPLILGIIGLIGIVGGFVPNLILNLLDQ